jgi:S1-C subfamily serine protease
MWSHFRKAPSAHVRIAALVMAASAAAGAAGLAATTGCLPPGDKSKPEVVAAASPAVVEITTFDAAGDTLGTGSGFFVAAEPERGVWGRLAALLSRDSTPALLVTNYHVIHGASSATAELPDRRRFRLERVVAMDTTDDADYALVRVAEEVRDYVPGRRPPPTVPLADPDASRIGDEVVAIGHPLGQPLTATFGTLTRRGLLPGRTAGREVWQMSAPIDPGSSGGPVLNLCGEVVGIASRVTPHAQLMNYAVPSSLISAAIADSALTDSGMTLPQVTEWHLAQRYARYEDPDGLFTVRIPHDWATRREVAPSPAGTAVTTTLAPKSALAGEQRTGTLAEGVRVTLLLPPRGLVFADSDVERWSSMMHGGLLNASPGSPEPQAIPFGGGVAFLYHVLSPAADGAGSRETLYIVQATPSYLLVVEVANPGRTFRSEEQFTEVLQHIALAEGLTGA